MEDTSIFIWNCRGAGKKSFATLIRDLHISYRFSVLVLLETKIGGRQADKVAKKLNFLNQVRVDPDGFAGGIWVCWECSQWNVEVIQRDKQFVHLRVVDQNGVHWFFSPCYGRPQGSLRSELWQGLRTLSQTVNGPWCVAGDFNVVMFDSEVSGGATSHRGNQAFRDCMNYCNLVDAGFKGPRYTWKRGSIKERLDRALVNTDWLVHFQDCVVMHEPFFNSDHSPLWIRLYNSQGSRPSPKPFKFIAAWLSYDSFDEVVKSSWQIGSSWKDNVSNFTEYATRWNKEVFGNIHKRKQRLINRLKGIQCALYESHNPFLEELQSQLWWEYEKVLFEEESIWMQKSRMDWAKWGDRNTRYFHISTLARRRRNKIVTLKDSVGNWVTDVEALKSMTKDFFKTLYCEDFSPEPFPISGGFPVVEDDLWSRVYAPLTEDEIRGTLFAMGGLKAPGPDGIHALFFKNKWSVVGKSLCQLVSSIFEQPALVKDINQTFVSLIPKVDSPDTLRQFRPISLCNVAYKMVTKIIASRFRLLMPQVIAPTQCAFIKGRQGANNVIIAQEVVHRMRNKTGKKGLMAIKIDLEKAYDKLDWSFIIDSLKDVGVTNHFIELIWQCISSSSMNILWNGECTGEFTPSRGIRQGDPLSPYLFVLCIERLSHLIAWAVEEGLWRPITISRGGPPLTHLCFADDLLIFAEVAMDQVDIIKSCLETFCQSSGQIISKDKTKIFFSKNVHHSRASEIANEFGFSIAGDLGKYLGVPLFHKKVNASTFSYVTDKLMKRLSSWKASSLSLAGRLTLCKSVGGAIAIYPMQSTLLPSAVCLEVDKKVRSFLWGADSSNRKIHLCSWERICEPKNIGGLSLRNSQLMNWAFMQKVGWGLINDRDELWVQVIRSRYSCGNDIIPRISWRNGGSNLWKGVCKVWSDMQQNLGWRIGDGRTVRFWLDSWVPRVRALSSFATKQISPGDLQDVVASFVNSEGNWDWQRLHSVLPPEICHLICGLVPPSPNAGDDSVCWLPSHDGNFSVFSVYNTLAGHGCKEYDPLYKLIWRWKGLERVRSFLWLLANNALLTNLNRFVRHITHEPDCHRCNLSVHECVLHALRDCPVIVEFWRRLVPSRLQGQFFSCNLRRWLLINLKGGDVGKFWPLMFGVAVHFCGRFGIGKCSSRRCCHWTIFGINSIMRCVLIAWPWI